MCVTKCTYSPPFLKPVEDSDMLLHSSQLHNTSSCRGNWGMTKHRVLLDELNSPPRTYCVSHRVVWRDAIDHRCKTTLGQLMTAWHLDIENEMTSEKEVMFWLELVCLLAGTHTNYLDPSLEHGERTGFVYISVGTDRWRIYYILALFHSKQWKECLCSPSAFQVKLLFMFLRYNHIFQHEN